MNLKSSCPLRDYAFMDCLRNLRNQRITQLMAIIDQPDEPMATTKGLSRPKNELIDEVPAIIKVWVPDPNNPETAHEVRMLASSNHNRILQIELTEKNLELLLAGTSYEAPRESPKKRQRSDKDSVWPAGLPKMKGVWWCDRTSSLYCKYWHNELEKNQLKYFHVNRSDLPSTLEENFTRAAGECQRWLADYPPHKDSQEDGGEENGGEEDDGEDDSHDS